ncbi:ATP-binding protein [Streptomyces sp. NPDC005408]|uniref:ATP-binding protein n=1 Tax=Streptomyces sp. NPDC005408 TaxID=3155341 RepID=UPI0033AB7F63
MLSTAVCNALFVSRTWSSTFARSGFSGRRPCSTDAIVSSCTHTRSASSRCASELATNALVHGVPPGRGYRLKLWLYGDGGGLLRVEVHDSGGGQPSVREPDGESGRGLLLVAALADKWGVGERDPGKIVWCEFAVTA